VTCCASIPHWRITLIIFLGVGCCAYPAAQGSSN